MFKKINLISCVIKLRRQFQVFHNVSSASIFTNIEKKKTDFRKKRKFVRMILLEQTFRWFLLFRFIGLKIKKNKIYISRQISGVGGHATIRHLR